ncbi:glycosyltransferase [candidate division WWE3 bacterium]|uniref:Glycosyltransferase n=1 Tax=candidate division WWE3 bacterium TaxID=2053526 RepID=A0A955RS90_UNCKA|nr:glycosyltransferase [candidate division WWE3 bacterium]
MRVGIYCTNNTVYPVPTTNLYANMTVAGNLADKLTELGHEVYFFAPKGTITKANLVTFDMPPYSDESIYSKYPHPGSSYEYENIMLAKALNYCDEHDVEIFHSHMRPFSVLSHAAHANIPIVVTIHDPIIDDAYKILPQYNEFDNVHLISLSFAQRKPVSDARWIANVYNGIDVDFWQPSIKQDNEYLLYVGRIMPNKGTDIAVKIANEANLPLKIIGGFYDEDRDYFTSQIEPYLNDNIEYLGTKTPVELLPLYQNALAFLMPIRWEEPFGLVMIEAMSCGTPVIASNKGSVPEIVTKKSGYIVDDVTDYADFVRGVNQVSNINRQDVRKRVLDNFTLQKNAESYLEVYKSLVE